MATYFEITSGMPASMAKNVAEMHFTQEGNGGWLGLSLPSTQRNIVLIGNDAVASMFRTHLARVGARFTESPNAPRGVVIHTVEVPPADQTAIERIKARVRQETEGTPRRRPWRRRGK